MVYVVLSLVVDGFRCKQSDGTIQEYIQVKYIVMDGETYGSVNNFCNLGDTLDVDGGVDVSATARIRNRCMYQPDVFSDVFGRTVSYHRATLPLNQYKPVSHIWTIFRINRIIYFRILI